MTGDVLQRLGGAASQSALAALAGCHVPFSAEAYSPVVNSYQLVVWVLPITELGA
ncbi:hypothetical protein F4560_003126 [Saccharothrix ecbatanensis]|uniref:Uncharacterized protein n=1 Tax=Saccharothrix ecbatanensis TaxID=1105145 RepID=A0A7W9HJC3_9PSEU|nr:hypothetical protein [Saccharothrix ecbatanensis]MBB5803358.1 hypothetical protein [Saccharothrix ecbatanensis]